MADALARYQEDFAAGLRGQDVRGLGRHFLEDDAVVARRLALYRGNVIVHATRALQAAFPVSRRIVGADFFDALAGAFWRAQPATDGDLNEYGATLADFIASFPPASTLPYLADVARLEWLVHRSHFAADAARLDLAMLASHPRPDEARMPLHPASALLRTGHPAASIWLAHSTAEDDEAALDGAWRDGPQRILVARPGEAVEVHSLDAATFEWLSGLAAGMPLGPAAQAALVADPDFDLGTALALAERCGALAAAH
ncbi:MAG TPA: DNA-binding domain-containing protein [Burkholderiaceae bacterium]|nr:DNA-binding domain-containing protein [Burkholderiaceae bacterium]